MEKALATERLKALWEERHKYRGARIRSTHVPTLVASCDRTIENGGDPEITRKKNEESDEEKGIYIDE